MTCRKTTVLYRILALVAIVALAALSWLTFYFAPKKSARADETAVQSETQPTHDEVFGANHANATAISTAVSELPSGSYYLTQDIVLTEMIEFFQNEDTKLCLHGHSITISGNHIFKVFTNSTLSIYDCGGEDNCGTVLGGKGVYVMGGTLNMYGGAIKEGYGGYGIGCGVTVSGNGVFNMYDGKITDNKASGNGGGGVCVGSSGTFNMYGGTISNNSASKKDGAGVFVSDATATFHMFGGSITNNTINFSDSDGEDTINFYGGAGVSVNGGTFTVEGNVNISGNTKGTTAAKKVNNVQLLRNSYYEGKIQITGKLTAGAKIGVTMPTGVLTDGYYKKGNTVDPSTYFICDDDLTVGFDDTQKEAEVKSGSIVGGYNMTSATVTGVSGTPTVGDTSVTLILDVTLENNVNHSTKTINDVVTVNLSSPLVGGENTVNADYTYNGADENKTEHLTYKFTPAKKHVSVSWACSDSDTSSDGRNAVKRNHDGKNILGTITATYTGYDGQQKTVVGTSNAVTVTDNSGNAVTSTADVGVYTVSLATSADYEFDNNLFTVTVNAAVVDEGYYKVQSVVAVGPVGTPTVGDTTVTVTVRKTLKHTKTGAQKTETATAQVTLSTALNVGNNQVSFDYKYTDEREGEKTANLSLTVTAAKKQVTVVWYYNNTVAASNSANRDYDGDDALGLISAKYTGVDGTQKTVSGASNGVIVKDESNNAVASAVNAGVYTISLAPQADYEFSNNSFTLTVNAVNVDDGYYKVQSVVALGATGTPTAGDKAITVSVQKTLVHTKTGEQKTETATTHVTLSSALHGGENKIAFDYKYNDIADGEKTVRLTLTVTAAKKQVALTWYYNDNIAIDNQANRVYDGTDVSDRIVAEYVGIDGAKQRVDGTSALMLKKLNGNAVSSLSGVGEYTLSLDVSADYTFGNNLFTYTVVQNLGDISDLTYEEDEELILGVSSDDGFAAGTEVVVEKVTDLDDSLVDGKISTALNVSFVNDSVEVTPTGTITVRVIIPDELRDSDAKYKIYNLNNGVATEVRFTADGNYATFELDELSTILFVTEESAPIVDVGNGGDKDIVVKLDDAGLVWIWVMLSVLAVAVIVVTVVLIVMTKRNKKNK